MGIKNLKKTIQKHAPGAITDFNLCDLRNSKIAVDSSILLYKYRYTYTTDNFHIMGFVIKITEFLENGIKPVFVFDGAAPEAKKETLDKRSVIRENNKLKIEELKEQRNAIEIPKDINVDEYIFSDDDQTEITENVKELRKINGLINKIQKNILYVNRIHSIEVMELLEILGIPFYKAPADAEETCAYLQKNDIVDYVMTEDTDSLVFGANKVLFGNKIYNLTKTLEEMDLTYDEFVDFSILCGCDYTCTIPKVGPVSALQIIKKYHTIEAFILSNEKYIIPDTFDYITSRSIFKGNVIVTENRYPVQFEKINEFLLQKNIPEFLIKKLIINFPQNNFLGKEYK